MRIAQVAPLAESVPPKLYGGTERVVSWLTEELVSLGHDVTLFATGDSLTSATLVPVWPRALRLSRPQPDPFAPYAVMLSELARVAASFDVIHCHVDWLHLPLLRSINANFVTTMHGRLDLDFIRRAIRSFPEACFVSISDNQRSPLPSLNWGATIYHGLPTNTLKPYYKPEKYLAFLGRITPEKGPETAIRLAKAARRPLRIAAKIPRAENHYFREKIKPLIDGNDIEFVGEVNEAEKQEFLGNAAGLLFPISWPEPFGLVMIEAMACGTPVIATRCGSVPEVVTDGVSGLVVNSEDEALAAIQRIPSLDRRQVRAEFERRFTSRRMAQEYEALYAKLVQKRTRPRTRRSKTSAWNDLANMSVDGIARGA